MTAEDHAKLENELQHQLQLERPRIIRQLAEARTDDSDLAKNAEYHATKQVQEQNESRIAELEEKLARAEVIDISKLSGDTVKFGATVTLIDQNIGEQKVWQIVGEPEADAKKGTISITSPLARALGDDPVPFWRRAREAADRQGALAWLRRLEQSEMSIKARESER